MPYVPPHLRGGNAPKEADAPPGGARNVERRGDYGGSFSSSARGGGSSRDGGFGYRDQRDGHVRRPLESKSSSIPEPVWAKWMPSDRVNRLQLDQISEIRTRLNVTVEITPGTGHAPAPIESFEDMNFHQAIMKDIVFHSYTSPTPIQAQAVPIALSGRDILGCAETGSGKTAAFSLPLIQHCLEQPSLRHSDGPLALVLAPTRELAQQIEKEIKAFSRSSPGFKTAIVVGGTHMSEQKSELRGGVEVVVATPGRLIDHLQQGNTSLSRVSFVVLDEADRMLDMGFEAQMREIMRGIGTKRQTLLFSATMPDEIETLAQEYLKNPVRVKVGRVSSPTENVTQTLERVEEKEKLDKLLQLLVAEGAAAEDAKQPQPLTIVFVERKASCEDVNNALLEQGLKSTALHGGRTQGEREGALRDFRAGTSNILVATDVAARGLDVTGVAHVINMDLPRALEDYVHRIGRTGRAGASGRATSFCTERDAFLVSQIKRAISEATAGNAAAFATGKAARRKEKEEAAAFREDAKKTPTGVAVIGSTTVQVESKYKHMLVATASTNKKGVGEGAADDAWDD